MVPAPRPVAASRPSGAHLRGGAPRRSAQPAIHPARPRSVPGPRRRDPPQRHRQPDGSWSSPLTPKPARRPLGPTRARYGRAGGPGFQPTRSDQAGSQDAGAEGPGPSPWQRSHQLWTEAGIEWERRPAPQLPWHPTASRSAARSAYARQVPPPRPPAPPQPEHTPWPEQASPWPERPQEHPPEQAREQTSDQASEQASWLGAYAPVGWAGRTPVPLGAPVYSEPGVDEEDGPAGDDRWGDAHPPIRPRPPGL